MLDQTNLESLLNDPSLLVTKGYVAGKYLQPLSETPTESILVPQETSIDFEILPVHLAENRTNITRRRDGADGT